MTNPVYTVEMEMVSGSYTNITNDVLQVSINRSVNYLFSNTRAGTCVLELDNFIGNYSPDNAAGDYAGLLRPDLPLRVHASHSGSTHVLFTGTIDEYTVQPALDSPRRTTISARDQIKTLANKTITSSLFTNINADQLFTSVLSLAGVSSQSIDTMADVIPFAWFRDDNAVQAIQSLLNAGHWSSYVSGNGAFNIKNRYFDQAGVSAVGSYSEMFNLSYSKNADKVYNDITIEAQPRNAGVSATIALLQNAVAIPASSHVSFFLEYVDPVTNEPVPATNLITPVSSQDYQAWLTPSGTITNYTNALSLSITFFGQTAVQTIFNSHSNQVYLTKYQVRGDPVVLKSKISAKVEQTSSQSIYGKLDFTLTNDFIGQLGFAQEYAEFLKLRHEEPFPILNMSIRNEWPAILGYELGEVLNIVNTHVGISSNMVIRSLTHDIDLSRGVVHQFSTGMELFHDDNLLILDDLSLGLLDAARVVGF